MLRLPLLVLFILVVAVGGGSLSVWYALRELDGLGALHVGPWTAYPGAGAVTADPYARAGIARSGVLPLGQAEGLAFVARADAGGNPLRRECSYRIEGGIPVARLWTLAALDAEGRVIEAGRRRAGLHAIAVLRRDDNSLEIGASARPMPGNWLSLSGAGPMRLVLTLYDSPIFGGATSAGIDMPQILRTACHE